MQLEIWSYKPADQDLATWRASLVDELVRQRSEQLVLLIHPKKGLDAEGQVPALPHAKVEGVLEVDPVLVAEIIEG